jgi:succinyl-CoA synthetase alpha subunit
MPIKAVVKHNKYSDSMSLMALSTKVNDLPFVERAVIGMGTKLNKQVIEEVGLATPETSAATPRDQIIVVQCATDEDCERALEQVEVLRSQGPGSKRETGFATASQAFESDPDASLVLISVPGEYAAAEARRALDAGKNVMIFSDNVSVEDELALKRLGHERELLVMGPDCGTAIINGTGLCFANEVAAGPVGVVAASGTGAQELSVRVDALGSGISQLIGVGGRDLSEAIGGIMMLDGLAMLDADPDTSVVVLLSKPPAPLVAGRVLDAAKAVSKPVVVCFIGSDAPTDVPDNVVFTSNTRDAALAAVRLATGDVNLDDTVRYDFDLDAIRAGLLPGQRFIRGLFCGGTVCDEVFQLVRTTHADTYSNVAKVEKHQLSPGTAPHDHALVDLGADEYTQGRPHPMIDPTLRNAEILKQAADPSVAVLLLDFELGYGSHPDPVGAAREALLEARRTATEAGRPLAIVAYVLGTDRDPQNKAAQVDALRDLGVLVVQSAVDLGAVAVQMIP